MHTAHALAGCGAAFTQTHARAPVQLHLHHAGKVLAQQGNVLRCHSARNNLLARRLCLLVLGVTDGPQRISQLLAAQQQLSLCRSGRQQKCVSKVLQ